jgi:hypothetical protein
MTTPSPFANLTARTVLQPNDLPTAPPAGMPAPNEDPDRLAARAAKQAFTDAAQAARENFELSDLAKARQISAAYDTYIAANAAAYERLTARRRARLDYLEQIVPYGPGIAEGTSPADKAVLMTAFRTALATAKDAKGRHERARLLSEAEVYDDDAMRRAVLTFALDNGEIETVRAWSEAHLDVAGHFNEIADLRGALAGNSHGWDFQDFSPLRKPREAIDLPQLERAAAASLAAQQAAIVRPRPFH